MPKNVGDVLCSRDKLWRKSSLRLILVLSFISALGLAFSVSAILSGVQPYMVVAGVVSAVFLSLGWVCGVWILGDRPKGDRTVSLANGVRNFRMSRISRLARGGVWSSYSIAMAAAFFNVPSQTYGMEELGGPLLAILCLVAVFAACCACFCVLRYAGPFAIEVDGNGICFNLGYGYSGSVPWGDVDKLELSGKGYYLMLVELRPGASLINTSNRTLYRVWPGVLSDASPFSEGVFRFECGGWDGDVMAAVADGLNRYRGSVEVAS